ncbi:uncharacterized protein M6B38_410825 [Iris pallida]|uniref:Mucin-like protein n=1 Tax=Iris pallida TaxID=29817 RepID=A0AAX6FNB2_IRIPA|nr:uncharacterized protein M6B38_410825 [Iris pallida]
MQSLQHILPKRFPFTATATAIATVVISKKLLPHRHFSLSKKKPSSAAASADDDWNDAWESAWLPNDSTTTTTTTPPWENSASATTSSVAAAAAANDESIDADTKAFVAEMDDRWSERRAAKKQQQTNRQPEQQKNTSNNDKDVYRLRKQRIHAGLWMKEIDKLEESRLGTGPAAADDIDRLLDSCSEIFDSGNIDLNDSKTPSTLDLKTKPDGWETTLKTQDGTIWDISQREEDILLQEFERRIAFSKFQIASFIKSHIFSRRRPVDGWKYMIEELGPNARRGKGSVQRLPSLADPSTQPFKEEKLPSIAPNVTSFRRR